MSFIQVLLIMHIILEILKLYDGASGISDKYLNLKLVFGLYAIITFVVTFIGIIEFIVGIAK